MISLWSRNYYHWLIDCLPRLATLRAAGLGGLPVVVPSDLTSFQRQSLSVLGVRTTTPYFGEDDHLLPDELVWASSPSPVNFPTPFVVDWLRRNLLGPSRLTGQNRRLFISRAGAGRLINEEQVIRALQPLNFELIRPERLDLATQVRTFAEAEVIVAPHGAGLTNMVFSDPLPVLELFSPNYVPWHYFTLARAAGHDYWYAVGTSSVDDRKRRHRDFQVEVDVVARTVEAMMGAR